MLSRLVITFLPRSKCLLISWLQSPSSVILEPKKIKSDTVSTLSLHDALPIYTLYIQVYFPITSWKIDGETVETVSDFIFLGSKITADGDCSHEIKRHLLLERKVMTNRQHIQKQRHYFANKGLSSQGYGFSGSHVWM